MSQVGSCLFFCSVFVGLRISFTNTPKIAKLETTHQPSSSDHNDISPDLIMSKLKGEGSRLACVNNNTPQLWEESRRENFGENNYHGDDVGDAAILSRQTVPILMTAVNDGTPFSSRDRDLPPSSLDSRRGFKAKKLLLGQLCPF